MIAMTKDWIAKCRRGDAAAMEALVQHFTPKLYKVAYSILGNAQDAEAATKEAFIKIFRSLPHFRGDFAPETWICRFLVNTCMDFLRTHGRFRPVLPEDEALLLSAPESIASPLDSLSAEAHHLLNTLPTDYMVILILCDMEGLPHKEVALMLDFPLATVTSRLSRARQLLSIKQKQDKSRPMDEKAASSFSVPDVPAEMAGRILSAALSSPVVETFPRPLRRIFSGWQLYALLAVCLLVFTCFYSQHKAPPLMAQKTNPYSTDSAPIPALFPAFPFGPMPAAPSPSPSPLVTPNPQSQQPAEVPLYTVPFSGQQEPTAMPLTTPIVPTLPDEASAESAPLPTKPPAPTATPTAAGAEKPRAKVYPPVSSLLQRGVTFVVDTPAAETVFQTAKGGGVDAVKRAFYQNGISFSTRETILEEYAASYNALAVEATALAQKIADGQGGNLLAQLLQKENEMEALKSRCAVPTLSLAYQ